jgi:hypothetical protein
MGGSRRRPSHNIYKGPLFSAAGIHSPRLSPSPHHVDSLSSKEEGEMLFVVASLKTRRI